MIGGMRYRFSALPIEGVKSKEIGVWSWNARIEGVCGRARSIIPVGESPTLARQVSHQIATIGQAEVTLDPCVLDPSICNPMWPIEVPPMAMACPL